MRRKAEGGRRYAFPSYRLRYAARRIRKTPRPEMSSQMPAGSGTGAGGESILHMIDFNVLEARSILCAAGGKR